MAGVAACEIDWPALTTPQRDMYIMAEVRGHRLSELHYHLSLRGMCRFDI